MCPKWGSHVESLKADIVAFLLKLLLGNNVAVELWVSAKVSSSVPRVSDRAVNKIPHCRTCSGQILTYNWKWPTDHGKRHVESKLVYFTQAKFILKCRIQHSLACSYLRANQHYRKHALFITYKYIHFLTGTAIY